MLSGVSSYFQDGNVNERLQIILDRRAAGLPFEMPLYSDGEKAYMSLTEPSIMAEAAQEDLEIQFDTSFVAENYFAEEFYGDDSEFSDFELLDSLETARNIETSEISETNVEIRDLEAESARFPGDESLLESLELEHRMQDEAQLHVVAIDKEMSVLSSLQELIPPTARPTTKSNVVKLNLSGKSITAPIVGKSGQSKS